MTDADRQRIAETYGVCPSRIPKEVTKVPRGETGMQQYVWVPSGKRSNNYGRLEPVDKTKHNFRAKFHRGRPPSREAAIRREKVRQMHAKGMLAVEIAKELDVPVRMISRDASVLGISFRESYNKLRSGNAGSPPGAPPGSAL